MTLTTCQTHKHESRIDQPSTAKEKTPMMPPPLFLGASAAQSACSICAGCLACLPWQPTFGLVIAVLFTDV